MEGNEVFHLIGSIGSIFIGMIFILGVIQKWKFIVDPPEKFSGFYFLSAVKKAYGKGVLIPLSYFFGIVCLLSGAYLLYIVTL